MITIGFDRQWTRKKIAEHKKQVTKVQKMQKELAELVAKHQEKIDVELEIAEDLSRSRDAAESNFEQRWGTDHWRKL